jgi:hypothetical protein
VIAPDGIALIAKHLYDHPEGAMPGGINALEKIKLV